MCSCVLALVNIATLKIGVQISFGNPFLISFGCIPRSGISESYGNSIKNF